MTTPIERAREAQRKIRNLTGQVEQAIHGLDGLRAQHVTEDAEDRALGRPGRDRRLHPRAPFGLDPHHHLVGLSGRDQDAPPAARATP